MARENDNQIIAASHSEVLLNEAAERDVVVAFVGTPHRMDDRGSQVLKALREIAFEHYYQAEQTGWVLYREATPKLRGVAIFDRLEQEIPAINGVECLEWRRREIENYLCYRETLFEYAKATSQVDSIGPLFTAGEASRRMKAMEEAIEEVTRAMETFGKGSPWDVNTKVSDDFLDPLFRSYF